MDKRSGLSKLTRSLMIGASVGTVGLAAVGCAPPQETIVVSEDAAQAARLKELCDTVMESRSARDMTRLMHAFPGASCINPILATLPRSTIAELSPEAISKLSPNVLAGLPPAVVDAFPRTVRMARAGATAVAPAPAGAPAPAATPAAAPAAPPPPVFAPAPSANSGY